MIRSFDREMLSSEAMLIVVIFAALLASAVDIFILLMQANIPAVRRIWGRNYIL
jgi:hypothetical protein